MSDELDIPTPTYRVPRRSRGMDPGTRRLALIAGGLGGALVLLVGGWSLLGNRSTTVPVIQADSSPMRVKPADPGGLHVAGANDDIMDNNPDAAADKLAPASETPAPQDMKPAAVASAPPAAAVTAGTASSAAAPIAAAPLTAKPLVAAPPVRAAAVEHPAHPVSGRTTRVQLAALSSEDAARIEWQRLEKRMPSLLASRQPDVTRFEHDGKTFWRLRTGGFSDIAQATQFCEQVRAKGGGCSIAAF